MRQAVNNLQSTYSGFGFVNADNVFKVCDQPHPVVIQSIIQLCIKGDIDGALKGLDGLWKNGYSAIDIVTTLFRVIKTYNELVLFTPGYGVLLTP
jgi:replication factor C subunit 2/4